VTVEEFRALFTDASTEVADKFYPKGETPTEKLEIAGSPRGKYLRDQAFLYILLSKVLTAKSFLEGDAP